MAIYHCSTKPLSRSSGRSAVAAAAYRTADHLCDERQGLAHNYTRRSGVLHQELVLPEGAGDWSRSRLWNAAERAETRKDARTAREWEVALPVELSETERRELAVQFAQRLTDKYHCAVDVAVHAPDREGDSRNWHAHLLATTRQVREGRLTEKCTIELSDAKRLSLALPPARKEVEAIRELWAEEVNRHLARAQQPERVDARSLAVQRQEALQQNEPQRAATLDREPQRKLGWKVVQMERRGIATDRGEQLRAVQRDNGERRAVVVSIEQAREILAHRQEQERARQEEQERQQQQARQQAERLAAVDRQFAGLSKGQAEALLRHWQAVARQPLPTLDQARQRWEQNPQDPTSRAWHQAQRGVATAQEGITRIAGQLGQWQQAHPIASAAVRLGLRSAPEPLAYLEDQLRRSTAWREQEQQRLAQLEQVWAVEKRPEYEQRIQQQRQAAQQCRAWAEVVEQNPQHFAKVWQKEHEAFQKRWQERERTSRPNSPKRGSEPDQERDGWSR